MALWYRNNVRIAVVTTDFGEHDSVRLCGNLTRPRFVARKVKTDSTESMYLSSLVFLSVHPNAKSGGAAVCQTDQTEKLKGMFARFEAEGSRSWGVRQSVGGGGGVE
ncbi:hypothetical protein BaRGS_00019791 [Batillaria attramentaria]|uniref:Uncharacterized protein n=1 Tax=Batillaria attramentaria TaxID=370345 RepID=A0ABD0KP58_9CAEN